MLQGIRKFLGLETRDSTLADPSADLFALFGAGSTGRGASALRSSTAAAAVRVIAETVGSLPIHVFKKQPDGSRERDTTHPAAILLAGDANPWTGASQLRTQIQADALLHRYGGFIQVIRAGGKVRELHRLLPGFVTPEIDQLTAEPVYRVRKKDGGDQLLSYTDIIHITTPGSTLDRPWSCADLAGDAISLDVMMADHQSRLFANGGRPSGVLRTKGRLSEEAIKRLALSWASAHGGANSGRTAVLENDVEFDPLTFNSVDLQFLELRRLAIEEIARVFKVPATLLGILDRATWRNVEELNQQFLTMCLLPWLEVWQSALDRALFTPEERKRYFVEAIVDDLLRADIASRYAALRGAVGGAWLTPNEARKLDNRPPIDGGDELIRQAGQVGADAIPDTSTNRIAA